MVQYVLPLILLKVTLFCRGLREFLSIDAETNCILLDCLHGLTNVSAEDF